MERHADVDALQVVLAGADDLDCGLVHEGGYGCARPGGRGTVEYTGAAGRGKGEAGPAAPLCVAVSPARESRYGPGVAGRAELPHGRMLLGGIVALALAVHLVGILKDLPYTPEIDEPLVVYAAVRVGALIDTDPGWFGHPASTLIYSLAGVYRLWSVVAYHGPLVGRDPRLMDRFLAHSGEFYLLGRLLNVAFALALGMAAIPIGFLLAVPGFLANLPTVAGDLRHETKTSHLGADGLSPAGNLLWYLHEAIPDALSWPVALLAVAGVLLVLRDRRPKPLSLVVLVVAFLGSISLSSLHWERWLIPVLPVLALL